MEVFKRHHSHIFCGVALYWQITASPVVSVPEDNFLSSFSVSKIIFIPVCHSFPFYKFFPVPFRYSLRHPPSRPWYQLIIVWVCHPWSFVLASFRFLPLALTLSISFLPPPPSLPVWPLLPANSGDHAQQAALQAALQTPLSTFYAFLSLIPTPLYFSFIFLFPPWAHIASLHSAQTHVFRRYPHHCGVDLGKDTSGKWRQILKCLERFVPVLCWTTQTGEMALSYSLATFAVFIKLKKKLNTQFNYALTVCEAVSP